MDAAELLERVEGVRLGGDVAFDFTDRLASENGWSRSFAEEVVAEYRKFVVMGAVSPVPVTPSDAVDQAWHLHLVYTRSYWEDLCRDVLGKPLHHGPTEGGGAERAKFFDWYSRTLAFYEETFGTRPPVAVWPEPEARFSGRFRRVDVGRSWVVPKPGWTVAGAVGLAVGLVTVVGCEAGGKGDDSKFVVLGVVLVLFFLIGTAMSRVVNRGRGSGKRRRNGGDAGSSWWGGTGCGGGGNDHHGDGGGCGGGGGGCGGD